VKIEYASANANVKRKRAWADMAAVGSRNHSNSQEVFAPRERPRAKC